MASDPQKDLEKSIDVELEDYFVDSSICQCGQKAAFGCEGFCRTCFHKSKFEAISIESRLISVGVPSRTAGKVAKLARDGEFDRNPIKRSIIEKSFNDSVFLSGVPGCGKTALSIAIMIDHMRKYNTEKEYLQPGVEFLFETTTGMIQKLQKAFKLPYAEEEAIINRYKNIDFLILDDIGVEKPSEWVFMMIYLIINHRYEEFRQTIFTSNFSVAQIAEKYGDERLTRRITHGCSIIGLG